VFEGLQLAEFGNRIPALSFEIVADDDAVTLAELVAPISDDVAADRALPGLLGFSDEGGPLAQTLDAIDAVYSMAFDAGSERLAIRAGDELGSNPPLLPKAAVDTDDGFGGAVGFARRRAAEAGEELRGIR